MPVTAKLSQAFYDRLGHQVADEMVDWFNQVDAQSRSDLREFNELNFARFDAKLEQRAAELLTRIDLFRAELWQRIDRVESELSQRIDRVESELSAKIEQVRSELSAKIDLVARELTSHTDRQIAALAVRIEHQQVVQLRWMIGMMAAMMIGIAGLWVRR